MSLDGILAVICPEGNVNRFWYVTCWVFEVLAILGLILALTVPVQDYLREYIEWHQHPTPEAYQAFLER